MLFFLIISSIAFFTFSEQNIKGFKNPKMFNNIFIYISLILTAWNLNYSFSKFRILNLYIILPLCLSQCCILSIPNCLCLTFPEKYCVFTHICSFVHAFSSPIKPFHPILLIKFLQTLSNSYTTFILRILLVVIRESSL